MSTFKDLLKEYCPNGVKQYKLQDICKKFKGTPGTTATLMKQIANPAGDIDIFAGGKTHVKAFERDIPNANITKDPSCLIQSRGIIDCIYCDGKYTFKNEMWSYSPKDAKVNIKYVYYFLKTQLSHLRQVAAMRPKMDQIIQADTDFLRVPLPPLEVQKKIVTVLDAFTELESELESELEDRNKQYGFYRAKLIYNGTPEVPLKDLIAITKGKQLNKELCSKVQTAETPFPVINGGMQPSGYWNECNFDKGKITIAQGGASGFVSWQTLPFWAGAHCFVVSNCDNKKLNYRYLYHFLKEKQVDLQFQKQGTTISSISSDALLLLNIPLPPLETQKEIADVLDKFTSLTSSMNVGIPAEISLRQRQMDWYRDAMFKALYSEEEK